MNWNFSTMRGIYQVKQTFYFWPSSTNTLDYLNVCVHLLGYASNFIVTYWYISGLQISGTALVLDEIINHVQSLQRQVEVRPAAQLIHIK